MDFERFAVDLPAGRVMLAAPRIRHKDAETALRRYLALSPGDRLKYLASALRIAESGKKAASAAILRRAPYRMVQIIDGALWRLRLAGEDGIEVGDFEAAAAAVGMDPGEVTAAELRHAIEAKDKAAGRLQKWEIVAARLLACVRGICGMRSKADDLFAEFPPKIERERKKTAKEAMYELAAALGAKIVDKQ